MVHRRRGGGGEGVSPDTFRANWLQVEGRGRGGVSLDTFTGKDCKVGGEGGGVGGVCADTRLPINKGQGQISAAPLYSKLIPEVFKMSRKLLRSSKVLEERMLGDTGCNIHESTLHLPR